MAITLDGTNGLTTPTYGGTDTSEYVVPVTAFKNRIINGAMMIDQRNAGASVTPSHTNYTLDRWQCQLSQTSKFTVQQNAGSVTPPAGFSKYLGVTSSSAYSITTSDYFSLLHPIEGLNVSDLAWGTASAQSITISFWVRSSLTGAFGGSVQNSAANRSYPFSYTISSANTWEYKTVTIAGDTTGTWLTTNGVGIYVWFAFGVGSTFSGTAGSWASANYLSATGATSVVGTNGATFYITGVQLEKGSTATSFDYRPYGTELALCQRYFINTRSTSPYSSFAHTGQAVTTSRIVISGIQFPVVMRTDPTTTVYSVNADTSGAVVLYNSSSAAVGSGFAISISNAQGIWNRVDGSASLTIGSWYSFSYTASAEL